MDSEGKPVPAKAATPKAGKDESGDTAAVDQMSPSTTNKMVSMDHYSTQELLDALVARGRHIKVHMGRQQAGTTIINRAEYLIDHLPGAVLRYTPAKDDNR